MEDQLTGCWQALSDDLLQQVTAYLTPNVVACSVRLLNKRTAALFQAWKTVRLSQPSPPHAFRHRWGNERGIRDLTLAQRRKLVELTAGTGVMDNLEAVLAVVGFPSPEVAAFRPAAAAGHVDACAWLIKRYAIKVPSGVIAAPARAGHATMVHWLLQHEDNANRRGDLIRSAIHGAVMGGHRALCEEFMAEADPHEGFVHRALRCTVYAAAEDGHVELALWLLSKLEPPASGGAEDAAACRASSITALLDSVVHGSELPTLQALFREAMGGFKSQQQRDVFLQQEGSQLLCTAVASPTPDWRAKVEWLEAQGCRFGPRVMDFSEQWRYTFRPPLPAWPDAVERVSLLRQRGLPSSESSQVMNLAVDRGNLPLVRFLLSEGLVEVEGEGLTSEAAAKGHVDVLRELLAAGYGMHRLGVSAAAREGHFRVLKFLSSPQAGKAGEKALREALAGSLMDSAANSGDMEMMRWLRARGCVWTDRIFVAAAEGGNMELVEWLAAEGCPMGDNGNPYLRAGLHEDMAMLRCLRRLGCPWDAFGGTFIGALRTRGGEDLPTYYECSFEVLRWLVDQGCPVNLRTAKCVVEGREKEVVAWVHSLGAEGRAVLVGHT